MKNCNKTTTTGIQLTINVSNFPRDLKQAIKDQGIVFIETRFSTDAEEAEFKIEKLVDRCYDVALNSKNTVVVFSPLIKGIIPRIQKIANVLTSTIQIERNTTHSKEQEIVDFNGEFCRFIVKLNKQTTNQYILKIEKKQGYLASGSSEQKKETFQTTVLENHLHNVRLIDGLFPRWMETVTTRPPGPLSPKQIEETERKREEKKKKKIMEKLNNMEEEDIRNVEKYGFTMRGGKATNIQTILSRMNQSESYTCEQTIKRFSQGLKEINEIFDILSVLSQKLQKPAKYAKAFLHGKDNEVGVECSMCALHCPHRFSVQKFTPRGRPELQKKRRAIRIKEEEDLFEKSTSSGERLFFPLLGPKVKFSFQSDYY